MEGLGLPVGGWLDLPGMVMAGRTIVRFGKSRVLRECGGRGRGARGGGGAAAGSARCAPAPPAASEQTFLSLQVEAGAAGGGGCTAHQAACAAERGAPIPDPAAPRSSGPGLGRGPSLSPLRAGAMARGGGRGRR